MCVTREPGIDLICIKPCSYHPLYHVETPYFVMPGKSYREGNFNSIFKDLYTFNYMLKLLFIFRHR